MLKDPVQLLSHHGSCQNWCVCPERGVADAGGGVSLGVGKGPCRTSRPTPATGDLPPSSGQPLHALTPLTPIRMHATAQQGDQDILASLETCIFTTLSTSCLPTNKCLSIVCLLLRVLSLMQPRYGTAARHTNPMLRTHQPRFHHAFTATCHISLGSIMLSL